MIPTRIKNDFQNCLSLIGRDYQGDICIWYFLCTSEYAGNGKFADHWKWGRGEISGKDSWLASRLWPRPLVMFTLTQCRKWPGLFPQVAQGPRSPRSCIFSHQLAGQPRSKVQDPQDPTACLILLIIPSTGIRITNQADKQTKYRCLCDLFVKFIPIIQF